MAMFASAISAQVKVVSNGNVTMSKDLMVSGVTKIKLVNEKDMMARPLSMVGTPSNKLLQQNRLEMCILKKETLWFLQKK